MRDVGHAAERTREGLMVGIEGEAERAGGQNASGGGGQGPPEASPHVTALRAEEVRAWLVQLRGGAPFLSSTDGKLLADWIEGGVPVATILRGLEAVAERRRAKRTRAPFTLVSAKATVEKMARGGVGWRAPENLVAALAPAEPDALAAAALGELAAITASDPETRAEQACAILRRFHARVWDELGEERATLLAAAAEELEPLREAMGTEAFARACEEAARDQVRARYPSLSATRVWQEFVLGVE